MHAHICLLSVLVYVWSASCAKHDRMSADPCRQLTIIEAILVGGAEIYRNTELDLEKRIYPGGVFDPLGLTAASPERTFNLKTAEIKHGRLAMIAFLGARLPQHPESPCWDPELCEEFGHAHSAFAVCPRKAPMADARALHLSSCVLEDACRDVAPLSRRRSVVPLLE